MVTGLVNAETRTRRHDTSRSLHLSLLPLSLMRPLIANAQRAHLIRITVLQQ